MASYTVGTPYSPPNRTAWGAIFGGTFVYLAIMSTFGALGAAIFADVVSSTGMTVWMAILGIISLYVAGRATGYLAQITERHVGMYHGLITFGMSVFTTVLVLALVLGSTVAGTRMAAQATTGWSALNVVATGGWALFCSLFLGMIACAAGASQNARPLAGTGARIEERPDVRRVA